MIKELVLYIKKIIYTAFDLFEFRGNITIKSVSEVTDREEGYFEGSKYVIGIVKERWHLHFNYIEACNELQISYVVIDLFDVDWFEKIRSSGIDALVFRPSVQYGPWKDMFDNRINILISKIDIPVFPNHISLWLWESKLRTLDWLKVNGLPYPKSYIIYDYQRVLHLANAVDYPIVYKSNRGSGSSGVKILKSKNELLKVARKVFKNGIRTYRDHKLDKEHGFMILQEFLTDIAEWRIIKIGGYYFGFEKIKVGQFHSGSQRYGYGMPPVALLEMVKGLSEDYGFDFVSVDIFLDKKGCPYINEIQPYFGQKDDRELLQIKSNPGRIFFSELNKCWRFEQGKYCRNNLCNQRIEEIINVLHRKDRH